MDPKGILVCVFLKQTILYNATQCDMVLNVILCICDIQGEVLLKIFESRPI